MTELTDIDENWHDDAIRGHTTIVSFNLHGGHAGFLIVCGKKSSKIVQLSKKNIKKHGHRTAFVLRF